MDNNTLLKNICLVCVRNIPTPLTCVCESVHMHALVCVLRTGVKIGELLQEPVPPCHHMDPRDGAQFSKLRVKPLSTARAISPG